uniref:Leucine-rich repeat-containing N-terminal plant-type domain-containing protein n=1 Tax=Setaria italica TaxID=4555 RepID=K3ZCY2_SETIT
MGGRGADPGAARTVVAVVGIVVAAAAVLSPAAAGGLGKEAAALVAIRAALHDPGQVLRGWDPKSGDPCHWNMVTCYGGHVQELSMTQQNLSGTLSPAIGRLRSLTYLDISFNNLSDDSQVMDKKVIIFGIYIGIGCILLAALVAGAVVLIWQWRRRQRVFAVADDEDPSLTYADFIQHYLLTMIIIP